MYRFKRTLPGKPDDTTHHGSLAGESEDGGYQALRHRRRQPQAHAVRVRAQLVGIDVAGVPSRQVAQVQLQLAVILRPVGMRARPP